MLPMGGVVTGGLEVPPLVTRGLVHHYDAGDASSVSSPTGSWNDLQGSLDWTRRTQGGTGTPYPQFNGAVGGMSRHEYWSFDNRAGSNAVAWFDNGANAFWRRIGDRGYPFSLCFWWWDNAGADSRQALYSSWFTGIINALQLGNLRLDIVAAPNNDASTGFDDGWADLRDQWQFLGLVLTPKAGNSTGFAWQNGEKTGDVPGTCANAVNWNATYSTHPGRLGAQTWGGAGGLNGRMAIVLGYDVELTEAEMLQNFRARRGRFGI